MPTGLRMPLAWHGALDPDTSQTCTLQSHITDTHSETFYFRPLSQSKGNFKMSIFSVMLPLFGILYEINTKIILIKLLGSM